MAHTTVMDEFKSEKHTDRHFQSEAALEEELIEQLCSQGYEHPAIHQEGELEANLRSQLEKLNEMRFTDDEWRRFFDEAIANKNEGVKDKTSKIQEQSAQDFRREDGSVKNILLIDKVHLSRNSLQVINQYTIGQEQGALYDNRYDVTILVNGLPLVHVELKRRGGQLKEAYNQIARYQRESFWAGEGLYQWVQIFVISDGTNTKYYAAPMPGDQQKQKAGFEFTSFWADAKGEVIADLADFAATFFEPYTLLSILTRYCVFTADRQLKVMRPYQIAAAERIMSRIEWAHAEGKCSTTEAGGYIWHTTGSGKTLTSFKAAQLATQLEYIDKVLFVVDRKDLDSQTIAEYDNFKKGSANGNTSTKVLEAQLKSDDDRIIVTTIQKLSIFIARSKDPTSKKARKRKALAQAHKEHSEQHEHQEEDRGHAVFEKRVVIIFDECHRSQFGEMHAAITEHFKHYYIFGFTGTPIFAQNAPVHQNARAIAKRKARLKKSTPALTTEGVFGKLLHTYTIVDAINDGNVLPFHVEYVAVQEAGEGIKDEQVRAIDKEAALTSKEHIETVVRYVLEHFVQKTYRKPYTPPQSADEQKVKAAQNTWRKTGFNAIFAADSVDAAMLYYGEFKRQLKSKSDLPLNVALIYSFAANEGKKDADGKGTLAEEDVEDTSGLDKTAKDFLAAAIADYNTTFGTSCSVAGEGFQSYYRDVSTQVKNQEVDLLIVVNMFLTGFDAKTLNTLFVDKNLRYHGLIQAFSRTNRILDSVKTFGNIVCFRDLQTRVDDAIALFANKDAESTILLRSFNDYYYGYTNDQGKRVKGWCELVAELKSLYPVGEAVVGEQNQRDFLKLFGAILRASNVLTSFDEFFAEGVVRFDEREWQDYVSMYLDMEPPPPPSSKTPPTNITGDLVYEAQLVDQIDINIDYILGLLVKWYGEHMGEGSGDQVMQLELSVEKAISSSPTLRSKKQLILDFVRFVALHKGADDFAKAWRRYVRRRLEADLDRIIQQERLKPDLTRRFVARSFRAGMVQDWGQDIVAILPPLTMRGGVREAAKRRVVEMLNKLLVDYQGLGVGETLDDEEGA